MKYIIISVLILLIIISNITAIVGKRWLNKKNSEQGTEEEYKKGMKYMIFSIVLSVITTGVIIILGVMFLLQNK